MSAADLKCVSTFAALDPGGMNWRGEWGTPGIYRQYDVVMEGETSYVCMAISSIAQPPSTNPAVWQALGGSAAAGVTGIIAGPGVEVSSETGVVTISVDANQGIQSVTAGSGISVSGSGIAPVIANTGILNVVGGPNVSVSVASGVATVSANVPTAVQTIRGSSGISVGGTLTSPLLTNTGVLSVQGSGAATVTTANGVATVAVPAAPVQSVTGSGIAQVTTTSGDVIVNVPAAPVQSVTGSGIAQVTTTSGAVTVNVPAAPVQSVSGSGMATATMSGGVVTINVPQAVLSIHAGTGSGIDVTTTDGAATLTSALIAGDGITLTPSTSGYGLTIAADATVTGVTSVTAGTGVTIGGTSAAPVIGLSPVPLYPATSTTGEITVTHTPSVMQMMYALPTGSTYGFYVVRMTVVFNGTYTYGAGDYTQVTLSGSPTQAFAVYAPSGTYTNMTQTYTAVVQYSSGSGMAAYFQDFDGSGTMSCPSTDYTFSVVPLC